MNKIKIGIISRRLPPATGGVENYLDLVCTKLLENFDINFSGIISDNSIDYPGVDDIFARKGSDYNTNNITVRMISPSFITRIKLIPAILRLVPIIRRFFYHQLHALAIKTFAVAYSNYLNKHLENSKLIHSYAFDGLALLSLRYAKKNKIPFIITPFVHKNRWGDSQINIDIYNQSNAVLSLHEDDTQTLISLGVNKNLIKQVGVCCNNIKSISLNEKNNFLQSHKIKQPYAFFIGRMVEHKGYRELIEAFNNLVNNDDLSLVLAGPASNKVIAYLSTITNKKILYIGEISEYHKNILMSSASLFVLPSDSEILPVSILEAWSVNVPVLTGDIPPLKHLLKNGKFGYNCPRESKAILYMLKDFLLNPKEWQNKANLANLYYKKNYTVEIVANRIKEIYTKAIGDYK